MGLLQQAPTRSLRRSSCQVDSRPADESATRQPHDASHYWSQTGREYRLAFNIPVSDGNHHQRGRTVHSACVKAGLRGAIGGCRDRADAQRAPTPARASASQADNASLILVTRSTQPSSVLPGQRAFRPTG